MSVENPADIWLSLLTTNDAVARSASAIRRTDQLIQQLDSNLIRKPNPEDELMRCTGSSTAVEHGENQA